MSIQGSSSYIDFDFSRKRQVSGWHNNCSLNCLTHYLIALLENKDSYQKLISSKTLNNFLKEIQKYYSLSDTPSIKDVLSIIQKYPAPTDREAIFGPVLRKALEEVIIKNAKQSWETLGSAAFSEYLNSSTVQDVAQPIIMSNQSWIDEFKKKYEAESASIKAQKPTLDEQEIALVKIYEKAPQLIPTDQQIQNEVNFQRQIAIEDKYLGIARAYWMNAGCKNYAALMGDLNKNQVVSIDQFDLLTNEFGIGLEVYTPDSIKAASLNVKVAKETKGIFRKPLGASTWIMKVFNGGNHWELQDPDTNIIRAQKNTLHHNEYYKNNKNDIFQILGPLKNGHIKNIQEQVHKDFQLLQNPKENHEEKTMAELVQNLSDLLAKGHISATEQEFLMNEYIQPKQKPSSHQAAISSPMKTTRIKL